MNQNFVFRSIILVIFVAALVFTLENHQNVAAAKNSNYNSKDQSKGSTIPLPFNSHIADDQSSTHKKKDSRSSSGSDIPFP